MNQTLKNTHLVATEWSQTFKLYCSQWLRLHGKCLTFLLHSFTHRFRRVLLLPSSVTLLLYEYFWLLLIEPEHLVTKYPYSAWNVIIILISTLRKKLFSTIFYISCVTHFVFQSFLSAQRWWSITKQTNQARHNPVNLR